MTAYAQPAVMQHPTKVTITCEFPDGGVWTLSSVAPAMKPSLHITEHQDQMPVGLRRDPGQGAVMVTGIRRDALFTVEGIDKFTITHPDGPSLIPLSYEVQIETGAPWVSPTRPDSSYRPDADNH